MGKFKQYTEDINTKIISLERRIQQLECDHPVLSVKGCVSYNIEEISYYSEICEKCSKVLYATHDPVESNVRHRVIKLYENKIKALKEKEKQNIFYQLGKS